MFMKNERTNSVLTTCLFLSAFDLSHLWLDSREHDLTLTISGVYEQKWLSKVHYISVHNDKCPVERKFKHSSSATITTLTSCCSTVCVDVVKLYGICATIIHNAWEDFYANLLWACNSNIYELYDGILLNTYIEFTQI